MPKHVIFLVHGMGDTVPGWSGPVQDAIKSRFSLYTVSNQRNFEDEFAFKELNYNHVFQSHIDKWKDNATAVTNQLEASGIDDDLLGTLVGFSEGTASDEFASTHILDVVLYRYMRGIKSQVIAHLSEQLVGKLNETAQVPGYSIISHSLGTAVMHDVMQANLTTDHFPLSTAHGLPQLYLTLANVSRVLEDSDTDVYRSAVRPELTDPDKAFGCFDFVNVAHDLDPFTRVRTFAPEWRPGAPKPLDNLLNDAYRSIGISGLTGPNPHDFIHYLDNPQTHVALFRKLMGDAVIGDDELNAQAEAHRQKTLEGRFDDARASIEAIEFGDQSSLASAIERWTEFQKVVKQFEEQL